MVGVVKLRVWCDYELYDDMCVNSFHVIVAHIDELTKTELNQLIVSSAREHGYIVTRSGAMYCPSCAKKLRLRNSCS